MVQTSIVHISDTHLGTSQYVSDVRRDDFTQAFERATAVAVERDVDAVIHTGDLFDDLGPTTRTVARCRELLHSVGERDIQFYGIVGNDDRRADERWIDLFRQTKALVRLGREPRVVGDTALYGIDSVRPNGGQPTDFTLAQPPPDVDYTLLCLDELPESPDDGAVASDPIEAVLERVDIDLDGLALGGRHRPTSARVDGTDIWYAGETERSGRDETAVGHVQLLEIDGDTVTRQPIELESRPPTVTAVRGTDLARVREALARHDLTHAVATVDLVIEGDAVTANQVSRMAREADVAPIDVEDERGHIHRPGGEREMLRTAQNAVEIAALLGFRRRSGRETETVPAGGTDELEHDDETTQRYDRRT